MIRVGAFGAGMKEQTASRTLALGLLVAVLVTAGLLLTAKPAHAAEFTVTETGDGPDTSPGNGRCDILARGSLDPSAPPPCTLRAAIEEANATSGADTIKFDIPGEGPHTIRPDSELPHITRPVTIDGYTQPGASKNTIPAYGSNDAVLKIKLDGSGMGSFINALTVESGGSGTTVRGLVVNNSGGEGIYLFDSDNNKIEGNFIGTDPSGNSSEPNSYAGVSVVYGAGNTVGGIEPEARNVISGNGGAGVSLSGSSRNRVSGNLIGSKSDGVSALGNGYGLLISGSFNTVGGLEYGAANIVRSSGCQGCGFVSGINVYHGGVGNRVLGNPIFSNTGMGIDLDWDGRTPNDPKDPDTGSNNLQNFPVITSATLNPDRTTTVKGTLNSTPSVKKKLRGKTRMIWRYFTIQFFDNPPGEDEGRLYSGQVRVRTNLSGDASFTVVTGTIPAGDTVTATATGAGGTSEFSDPVVVTEG